LYRDVAYVLRLVGASHEAVRQWVLRLEGLAAGVRRRGRRAVAVDETVLKLGGVWLYVWAAVDVDSRRGLGHQGQSAEDGFGCPGLHEDGAQGVQGQTSPSSWLMGAHGTPKR